MTSDAEAVPLDPGGEAASVRGTQPERCARTRPMGGATGGDVRCFLYGGGFVARSRVMPARVVVHILFEQALHGPAAGRLKGGALAGSTMTVVPQRVGGRRGCGRDGVMLPDDKFGKKGVATDGEDATAGRPKGGRRGRPGK